jgi:hypothetical protein
MGTRSNITHELAYTHAFRNFDGSLQFFMYDGNKLMNLVITSSHECPS